MRAFLLLLLAAAAASERCSRLPAVHALRCGEAATEEDAPIKISIQSVPLCKPHLDRRSEVRARPSHTVRELKEAVSQRFPGRPPVELLRLFYGEAELTADDAVLAEAAPELFEVKKPTIRIDLILATAGREDSRSLYQSVDRLTSAEERIEAYAATHAALKFFLDLLESEDPSQALDAKQPAPAGRAEVSAEERGGGEEGEVAWETDDDEELEEQAAALRTAEVLSQMEGIRGLLMGQLKAYRDEQDRTARQREQEEQRDAQERERISALIRSGTLSGRAKRHLAVNFNTDLRSLGQMMLGLGLALRFGAVAPHMKPLMHLLMVSLVAFQTRPVRLATKVALNMLPQAAVQVAASFLSVPQALILTQDYKQTVEDLYGKGALEKESKLLGALGDIGGDGAFAVEADKERI